MTSEFYSDYYKASNNHRLKEALFFNNPNKFMACHHLVKFHEARGDKIMIFCDHIFALKEYAYRLGIPFICGDVSELER
jgi:DNA excision repair protein ERCC-3